ARPLGEPHRAEREQRDNDEINENADHCEVGFGWALFGLTNLYRELGALPLPACGERVGVRGILQKLSPRRAPLTRRASRRSRCGSIGVLSAKNGGRRPPMLSPRAGRGRARSSCVHSHHLLSPASASAARRRLASMAAVRACTLLIQASA